MVKLKQFRCTVKGIRPLFMHRFLPDVLSTERKKKTGSAGNSPDEWKSTALVAEDGVTLYIPGEYFFSSLRAGSFYTKVGRGSIQKTLVATLIVLDKRCILNYTLPKHINELANEELLEDNPSNVYLDMRGVINPATKGRNLRYRLALREGWEVSFTGTWDESLVSVTQMKQIVSDSGIMSGLADGRSIGMGRYEVVDLVI